MKSTLEPNPEILERNLSAIGVRSPMAAQRISDSEPSELVEFSFSGDGHLVGSFDGRAMCSKRKPIDEARTWARGYQPEDAGFLGVVGFGLGYHLQALSESHQNLSVLLCFEPDIGILRAVLERIDHSQWIGSSIFLLATDAEDSVAVSELIKNAEAFLATGVEIAPHPPSKKRLEGSSTRFTNTLLDVVRSTRTHLVTILAHSGFTLRNILMNAGAYASSPGILPLKESCRGQTAILIAAGPSLERNLALLEDPRIRDRAVIIAVQTMLKPLLERGIKPHFVTALDHHEISKRFYEGLREEDVRGVRLIVEPKANAAIVDTFPGEVLCVGERQLDELLGPELAREMGSLTAGATVAHLNFYLAKHLGCSTMILIGQDLGFTDGQYYAAGASIHHVWASELSEHRTLEMFEWERIARMKCLLRLKEDIHGRPIFTDEQMSTYIAQFESDFQHESAQGLRIINATQGGVHIAGTEIMTLREALEASLTDDLVELPETDHLHITDPEHHRQLVDRIKAVLEQLESIEQKSEHTLGTIQKAQRVLGDRAKLNRHIESLHTVREQVLSLHPAFDMVNFFNQKGGLNRFKVDRLIKIAQISSPTEKASKQLDRDANNVRWIEDSAREVHKLLSRSLCVIEGTASPMTRDEYADEPESAEPESSSAAQIDINETRRIEAVIFADPEVNSLGMPRNLLQPIYKGETSLGLTIARLNNCDQLNGVTVVTPDPDAICAMHLDSKHPLRVVGAEPNRERVHGIGQARCASADCWRGSIANLSCYDELFDPSTLGRVMDEHSIDAAALVGPDWVMLDFSLADQIMSRHRSDPDRCHILFSQAVPGIGCCVIDRSVVGELVKSAESLSALSTIGGILGYIPVAPQGDPIASSICVGVDPFIRDAGVRAIADSTTRIQASAAVYQGLGDYAISADATVLIKAYIGELAKRKNAPSRIELELSTAGIGQGVWGAMRATPDQSYLSKSHTQQLISDARVLRDDCTVLFSGRGDPLGHPDALGIVSSAADRGVVGIELRTDLIRSLRSGISPEALIQSGIGVLSVDILANTPGVYSAMTGTGDFEQLLDFMQALFDARPREQLPTPWIVPRITRCDAAYLDIQGFYDRWLTVCGCAVIDANPNPDPSDRIQPLPIPSPRSGQLSCDTLRIQADGQVVDSEGNPIPNTNALELGIEQSYQSFRRSIDQSIQAHIEPKTSPGSTVSL